MLTVELVFIVAVQCNC